MTSSSYAKLSSATPPADFWLDDQDKPNKQPKNVYRAQFRDVLIEPNFRRIAVMKVPAGEHVR